MFSSSPKLKTEPRTTPGAFRATPIGVPRPVTSVPPLKPGALLSTHKTMTETADQGGQTLVFGKYDCIY